MANSNYPHQQTAGAPMLVGISLDELAVGSGIPASWANTDTAPPEETVESRIVRVETIDLGRHLQ